MFRKRMWIVGLCVALLLAVAAGTSRPAAAQSPGQTTDGITIPYSGRLTLDGNRSAPDGAYAMQFSLYAEKTGGMLLWAETQMSVAVRGGAFAVILGSVNPIPKIVLESRTHWLAVSVRGPGDADFVALAPRQQIRPEASAAPTSLSCVHNHFTESWSGAAVSYGLRVENTGTGDGVRGYANVAASNYAGVYGVNYAAGPGVYGRSDGGGPGVAGYSSGRGVYGSGADGVVGESATNAMSGVYGYNSAAGVGYGVTGRSANGFGILAWGTETGALGNSLGDILLQGNYGEIFAEGMFLDLYTNDNVYVDLDNDNNSPMSSFAILSGSDSTLWSVAEPSGNVVAAGSQASAVQTAEGQRLLYAIQGAEVWLEDIGTAALGEGGQATITFDAVYVQAANLQQDYQVFVTPVCAQPVILYVSAKTATGFTVSGVTLDGKPATCSFDYRVVASRQGYENVRLEQYSPAEKGQP